MSIVQYHVGYDVLTCDWQTGKCFLTSAKQYFVHNLQLYS